MFPTIMCNYSLFPRHLSQEFRNLYKSIRDERIKAKNEGNKERASFLKNILNSSIGLMNSDWSYMYDPVMNTCIRIQSMFITLGLIILFILVGSSNAVNLTDGLDGLAAGVNGIIMIFFTFIAMAWGDKEMSTFSAIMTGTSVGFLLFNLYPS